MAELIDVSWDLESDESEHCYGELEPRFTSRPEVARVTLTVKLVGGREIRGFLDAVGRFFGVSRQGHAWTESYCAAERGERSPVAAPRQLGGRDGR